MPEIRDCVELRVGSGEDRGVGNRSQWSLGKCVLKDDSLSSQSIEMRRKPELGAEKSHAIGTGGIDSDQNDVRGLGVRTSGAQREKKENNQEGTLHRTTGSLPKVDSLTKSAQKDTARPNCILRCAPVPRMGFRPIPTSGVAKNVPKPPAHVPGIAWLTFG